MAFNGGDSADNQDLDNASFITTSGILTADQYPQFDELGGGEVRPPGWAVRPAYRHEVRLLADRRPVVQALDPHGERARPAAPTCTFWTSYNTELDWDHLFVEAHTVGQDDWTTLPDPNGHTRPDDRRELQADGPGGWRTIHPFMDHYQTIAGARLRAARHDRRLGGPQRQLRRLAAVASI